MNAGLPPDLRSSASTQKSKAPKQAQLKAHFEEMKSDAATLAELANSLKADLDKANPNELPATLAEKVEQINKLAKRIGKLSNNF
jgi:type VI protein secretion system component VasF